MKLAIQENLLPGQKLEERLVLAEELGFAGIEFWGRGIHDRLKEIKDAVSATSLKVSTICSGYRGDLLSANREERELAVKDIERLLDAAANLGAIGVIVVPTFGGPKLPDLAPLYRNVWELEKALLVEELKVLGKKAEDVGSHVLVEPLNRYETHFLNRVEQAISLLEEVASPGVSLMIDFFHMNIEEADISEAVNLALPYLKHIHLADSNRLPPGFGHTDFKKPFKALKRGGYRYFMALECRIPEPRIENLRKTVEFLKSVM